MKRKKIDNFVTWRRNAIRSGLIAAQKKFIKNGDLAELIGIVHGDGSIHKYTRTEGLRIVMPTKRPALIAHVAELVERVFGKKPGINKRKDSACVNIDLYQKGISARLEIPVGNRENSIVTLPVWIMKNKKIMIRYLRGLYEAEGSFSVHKATYTYKLHFSNKNQSILDIVHTQLMRLGFHPHRTAVSVQISKKKEVFEAIELLQFRKY